MRLTTSSNYEEGSPNLKKKSKNSHTLVNVTLMSREKSRYRIQGSKVMSGDYKKAVSYKKKRLLKPGGEKEGAGEETRGGEKGRVFGTCNL